MTLAADQHLPHFIMWGSHVFYQLYGFNFSGSNQETWIAHKWLSPAGVGRRFTHLSSLRVLLQCSSTKSWRMRSLVVCERRGSGSEGRGERRGQGGVKVDEGGRKKTCWDRLSLQNICWNYEQLTVWKTNPGLQEHFVNFWIVESVNNMCVWQWRSYSSLSECQFCICKHKTARKQASDTNVFSAWMANFSKPIFSLETEHHTSSKICLYSCSQALLETGNYQLHLYIHCERINT